MDANTNDPCDAYLFVKKCPVCDKPTRQWSKYDPYKGTYCRSGHFGYEKFMYSRDLTIGKSNWYWWDNRTRPKEGDIMEGMRKAKHSLPSVHPQRKVFEDSLIENPYDLDTRLVFADWLDEYGDDTDADLAAWHRAWTPKVQRVVEAKQWLTDLAHDVELDYDRLMETLKEATEDANPYLHFGTDWYDRARDEREKMWECYTIITGIEVSEETIEGIGYSCSC